MRKEAEARVMGGHESRNVSNLQKAKKVKKIDTPLEPPKGMQLCQSSLKL